MPKKKQYQISTAAMQGAIRKLRLERGDALVGTIDTYLIYRLTGGRVFATDHTNSSRTLLYDIVSLRWDPCPRSWC